MKNHLGTLGLWDFWYYFVNYFQPLTCSIPLISTHISELFQINLQFYRWPVIHIYGKKRTIADTKKCRKKHYTSCGNINSLSLQREKPFAQSTVFCFRKADHQ